MKTYPLSYTFAWAADAEIHFFENTRWKIQEQLLKVSEVMDIF